MLVFSRRPSAYKAGLLLLLLGFVFYTIGFSTPYWVVYQVSFFSGSGMNESDPYFYESIIGYNGLWEMCGTVGFSMKVCSSIAHEKGHPAWVSAAQGLQCVGLVGLIAACGYALVVNFVQRSPNINNRHLEILVIVSGVIGFVGSIVYAVEASGNDSIHIVEDEMYQDVQPYEGQGHFSVTQNDLAWSYFINLTGCVLSLLSTVVICASNRLMEPGHQDASPSTAVSFSAAGASTGGNLEFLPPQHLAGGFRPPEVTSRPSAEV